MHQGDLNKAVEEVGFPGVSAEPEQVTPTTAELGDKKDKTDDAVFTRSDLVQDTS